jgi:hypothetical protein
MQKNLVALFALGTLLVTTDSYGFGHKKMQISELKGVTETQVALNEGKATVMVRGKAAELLFRTMKTQQEEQIDTDALKWIGAADGAEWTVKGKQITCSKLLGGKKKQEDYACAFSLDQAGTLSAAAEAFDTSNFNLARTETGSNLFRKKSRSLASVAPPPATYSKGLAYLVYDEPGKQRSSRNALIVFRGDSAKEILGLLENEPANKEAHWGEAVGRKGQDIACVGVLGKEPERCALVVTFKDGSITRSGNPLFR